MEQSIAAHFDGKVFVPDEAVELPVGKSVRLTINDADQPKLGMREEDWSNSPEAVAEWLEWYDSLEPFLTPEEEAVWKDALKAQKDHDRTTFEEDAKRLEKMWE